MAEHPPVTVGVLVPRVRMGIAFLPPSPAQGYAGVHARNHCPQPAVETAGVPSW